MLIGKRLILLLVYDIYLCISDVLAMVVYIYIQFLFSFVKCRLSISELELFNQRGLGNLLLIAQYKPRQPRAEVC